MSFIKWSSKTVLTMLILTILTLFAVLVIKESYNTGLYAESKNTTIQAIAILDLNAENENLKSSIITLKGDNATLRIITQTQQEEISNLKSTVMNLNSSLTSLKNEKEATVEVVANLQNDITYLNNYVAELEDELNALKSSIVVIYLPKELSNATNISVIRLNEGTLLISGYNSKVGLWEYSLTNKNLKKVADIGGSYTEIKKLTDNKCLIYSNICGEIVSYDKSLCEYKVAFISNNAVSSIKHIDFEKKICLIYSDNYFYNYDYENDVLTKYANSNKITDLLYVKGKYVYFAGINNATSYHITKVNIEDQTSEMFAGGAFYKYFKLSDTQILSKGLSSIISDRTGLWLFDFESDTMTRIIKDGYIFTGFKVIGNYLYCCNHMKIHRINLNDWTVSSLDLNISVSLSDYEKEYIIETNNGMIITNYTSFDAYAGLYYVSYDLTDSYQLTTVGYSYMFLKYNNYYFISSEISKVGGLYCYNLNTDKFVKLFDTGFYYNCYKDLGEDLLVYSSLKYSTNTQNLKMVLINKETLETSLVNLGSYYSNINIIHETSENLIIQTYGGIFKLSKNDFSVNTIALMNNLYEIGRLNNGNILFMCDQYVGITYLLDINTYTFNTYSAEIEVSPLEE